jgi:hypothetical protein
MIICASSKTSRFLSPQLIPKTVRYCCAEVVAFSHFRPCDVRPLEPHQPDDHQRNGIADSGLTLRDMRVLLRNHRVTVAHKREIRDV